MDAITVAESSNSESTPTNSLLATAAAASSSSPPATPSRYESQKRRDWNTFGQYLKNHCPPLSLARCSGAHVLEFLRYLDQFGKTKVHTQICPFFGYPNPPTPCPFPLRQAWGSLDALIGLLRAAYEEHGGKPEANPFGARAVRLYLRESKWVVAAIFGAILIWKHDAEVLWTAMGSILNIWLSITLKRILNQQRPVPALKSDPGMPSSHAQSIFFFVVFIALALFEWLGINAPTLSVGALVLSSGAYLSWLRVSQQLHTISQVVVGAIIGTVFSAGWFYFWHGFVLDAFLSFLWVRLVVVLSAVGFCAAFALYVIKNWLLVPKI